MNYLKEINAFYDEMERNPLSASAVTLWHALMHMNNKAMWSESFTVSSVVLRIKSGLTESSFKRARKELVDEGYIDYKPSKNRKAPTYQVISLCQEQVGEDDNSGVPSPLSSHEEASDQQVNQTASPVRDTSNSNENGNHVKTEDSNEQTTPKQNNEPSTPKAPQSTARQATPHSDHTMNHTKDHSTNQKVNHNTNHNAAPLYKQNINNKKQDKTLSDAGSSFAIIFFEDNFENPKTYEVREIEAWIKQLGEDLVIKAMERALKWNVPKWAYVKSILQSWQDKGIKTTEEAFLEELDFEEKRKKRNRWFYHPSLMKTDSVPDWFEEQKREIAREEEMKRREREMELNRLEDPHYANQVKEELEGLLGRFG